MKHGFTAGLFPRRPHSLQKVLDAEYAPCRENLRKAGLSEAKLREMDPDDRVAVLEGARLDPYDFIYLAC